MMKVSCNGFACIAVSMMLAVAGCQQPTSDGDLDTLVDMNDNGFDDIAPPDGVTFDDETNARVTLNNTIGTEEIAALAEAQGIDSVALNFVAIEVDLVMTLIYDGFENVVVRQSQALEPFTRQLEAACPDALEVDITVTANAPVVGPQIVFSDVFELTRGTDYNCGGTLEVETFVDDAGNPQVDVSAM